MKNIQERKQRLKMLVDNKVEEEIDENNSMEIEEN